jgi:hypothetical protein
MYSGENIILPHDAGEGKGYKMRLPFAGGKLHNDECLSGSDSQWLEG